jgi:hypothetical protein
MENYIPTIDISGILSGIYNLFTFKKKVYTPEDMNNTISKLKNIQINITTRIENINNNINKFFTISKEKYIQGNNKSALYNLKLKKMYEREKEKLDSINFSIESQIFTIESMGLIIDTVETLKDTSIHMKSINSKLDIDKIESTMEELHEHKDIGEELQNIFSESISLDFNEDELLNELEELQYDNTTSKDIIIKDAPVSRKNNEDINSKNVHKPTISINDLPIISTNDLPVVNKTNIAVKSDERMATAI